LLWVGLPLFLGGDDFGVIGRGFQLIDQECLTKKLTELHFATRVITALAKISHYEEV